MIEARDVKIFTILEKIVEEQKDQRRLLKLILAKSATTNTLDTPAKLPNGAALPMTSIGDMNHLDNLLKGTEHWSSVVRYLGEFGGSDVKETVSRILKEVMSSRLFIKYYFMGKKGKLVFGTLQLISVIYKCVKRNPATKHSSRKYMEMAIKKWLVVSRDQDGGRNERAHQATRQAVSVGPSPELEAESNSDMSD